MKRTAQTGKSPCETGGHDWLSLFLLSVRRPAEHLRWFGAGSRDDPPVVMSDRGWCGQGSEICISPFLSFCSRE